MIMILITIIIIQYLFPVSVLCFVFFNHIFFVFLLVCLPFTPPTSLLPERREICYKRLIVESREVANF